MILSRLFDPDLSVRLCLVLLHSVWQVALLTGVVWLVDRWRPNKSIERSYVMHVLALVVCLAALPMTYPLVDAPPIPIAEPGHVQSAKVAVLRPIEPPATKAAGQVTNGKSAPVSRLADVNLQPPRQSNAIDAEGSWSAVWMQSAPWLAAAYAAGVVLMLIRLAIGIVRAERLCRLGQAIADGPIVESLKRRSLQ